MEQRAKFRELRLAWTSREDAMKQAYWSVAPVTPTANPPINPPNPTAAPPQTMQGVNGEIFQIAPVNPQTGLSQPTPTPQPVAQPTQPVQPATPTPAPVTPSTTSVTPTTTTPTPEVKPTPVKTEAPINYNTSVGREAEIQKNVAEITKGNPALLKDRNAFNKAFWYDTADQGKKALLDSAFMGGNQPMDQKSVLNAFISGVSVPEQNTQAYRNAKVQFDTFKKFNAMTPTQLLDNLKQGQIGTEMDALLNQNPNYAQAKAELAKFQKNASLNRMVKSALNVVNGREPDDLSNLSKIEAKYNAPPWTNQEAYQAYVVQNEDVKKAWLALNGIARQISDTTKLYNDALTQIKKDYPDLSAPAILVLMQTKTKDTRELLDSLVDAKTLAQGDFDLAMKMAEGNYEAYTKDLANANEIAKEQRAMENSLTLSQMQFDQKIAQQAETMGTPELAIPSVINQYAEMGIMASKSAQQHIADAKAFITRGGTLGEYISQMQRDFQAKPEYKAKFTQKASEFGFQNLGGWMIAVTDPKTGNVTFKNVNWTTASGSPVAITTSSQKWTDLLNAPEGTIIPSRLSKTTNPNNGKECGEYINDIAGASLFGDTIEQKKSVAKETTGWIGKAIVWQPSNSSTFQKYGHVWIIIGQNPDGSWKVKSSNIKWDGAISIDNVPASVALGYKTLPWVSMQAWQNSPISQLWQYMKDNQQRWPWYSEEDVKAFNEKIDRFVKNWDEKGIALAFRTNLFQDKDFKQEFDNTKKFTTALDQVQTLINQYEASGKSTNALQWMAEKVARSLWITTDQALAQLQTQMWFTLANYIKSISGTAASDAEVQRLMGNMANISNVKDLNTTILSQVKNNADQSLRSMIDTRMYGMPEDLKYEVFSDVYTASPVSNQNSMPSVNNTLQSDWDNLDNLP